MSEREGYADTRPSGMTVREHEREERRRVSGELGPDAADPSGSGTVSEQIERETVVGGHGHGGALDLDLAEE